jgi:HJR/Mrr/RecB family endonuclease
VSFPVLNPLRKLKHWCLHRTTRFGKEISARGIAFFPYDGQAESAHTQVIDAPESLLRQLQLLRRQSLCSYRNRKFELSWSQVYAIIAGDDPVVSSLLHLDTVEPVQLAVVSTGRIGSTSFQVRVEKPLRARPEAVSFQSIDGVALPVATTGRLLSPDNFNLMEEIAKFQNRPVGKRISEEGEAAWSRIVYFAQVAGADVSGFTTQRDALTVEKLRLVLDTREQAPGKVAVELVPYFSGSPQTWREAFLCSTDMPCCYEVPGRLGRTQVDVCPEVAPMVFEAKRLTGRRVAATAPLLRHLQIIDQSDLEDMSPEAFELVCALIYRKSGYAESFRVGGSGDGGVDVVALRGSQGLLLQCKSSKELDKRLGWDGVKDVVAGEAGYRMQYPGVQFQKLALTNQFFNETAKTQARLNNVLLLDKTDILKEIRRLHISYFELRYFSKGAV